MLFSVEEFNGQIPRRSKRLLGRNQAEEAVDCDVLSGSINPFEAPSTVEQLDADDYLSIYQFDATGEFLKFKTDVDVVRGPIAEDPFERIYYTGDGAPKIRGLDSGTEFIFDLGIPKPVLKPQGIAQAQSSTNWTRTFHYFYEEPDGSQSDADLIDINPFVTEIAAGVSYLVTPLPAKVAASPQSTFVLWFEAFDTTGASLGRLYPATSSYAGNNDFFLGGAQASSLLVVTATDATLTITYDTSRSSEFTKDRSYVYTFVTALGEEGPPSDPSDIIVVEPSEDALISNLDVTAAATSNITRKRIYRTVTGSTGVTSFQFVDEIDLADATFLDTVDDASTGEILSTNDNDAPPVDLKGLVSHPGGFLAGFSGKSLYVSKAFLPHAWPTGFSLSFEWDIVGLGISGNTIVVLTNGYGYAVTGDFPGQLTSRRMDSRQACSSKRSITQMKDMVIYASPDGLVGVNGASAILLTEEYYRRGDWQELKPETMVSSVHDKRYLGFAEGGNIVFDFDESLAALVQTTVQAQGLYSDLETDSLFMIVGSEIQKWRGSEDEFLQLRWKSWEIPLDRPVAWNSVRVDAEDYDEPVFLRFYANDELVLTMEFFNDEARRVPLLRDEKHWAIEVLAKTTIYDMTVATSMAEIREQAG